jgi:hypothetical protein
MLSPSEGGGNKINFMINHQILIIVIKNLVLGNNFSQTIKNFAYHR